MLGGGGNSARAACIEGAQCAITDGSQITQSGGHFSSTGFDTPAFAASDTGSQIKADNVTIDNGSNPLDNSYFLPVMWIEDGGEIILDSSTIDAWDGVLLYNPDSQFTMKDGTITIEGEMSAGISLQGESTDSNINQIQLRDSQLSVQGDLANVIETRLYSDFALERVKINLAAQNSSPNTAALKTNTMAQISLHDSSIEVENASGAIICCRRNHGA